MFFFCRRKLGYELRPDDKALLDGDDDDEGWPIWSFFKKEKLTIWLATNNVDKTKKNDESTTKNDGENKDADADVDDKAPKDGEAVAIDDSNADKTTGAGDADDMRDAVDDELSGFNVYIKIMMILCEWMNEWLFFNFLGWRKEIIGCRRATRLLFCVCSLFL